MWRLVPVLVVVAVVIAVVALLAPEEEPPPSLPAGTAYARDLAVDRGVVVGADGRAGSILVRYGADGTVEKVATTPEAQLAAVTPELALGSRIVGRRYRPELLRISDGTRLASAPVGDGDAFGRALAAVPGRGVVAVSDARLRGRRVVGVTRFDEDHAAVGTSFVSMPGRSLSAAGVAVGPDGTIVVAGTAYDSASGASDPFVARLSASGVPLAPPARLRSGADGTVARGLALDSSGQPVVAASGRIRGRSVFLALRGDRVTAVPVGPSDAFASDVAVDRAGDVVLVGSAAGRGAVVRLSRDGAVESKRLIGRGQLAAVAIDRQGRVVAAGSALAGPREKLMLTRP